MGKAQIWCAVSTYVFVAIVKKELHLDASLYTLLQSLSVSAFEKTHKLGLWRYSQTYSCHGRDRVLICLCKIPMLVAVDATLIVQSAWPFSEVRNRVMHMRCEECFDLIRQRGCCIPCLNDDVLVFGALSRYLSVSLALHRFADEGDLPDKATMLPKQLFGLFIWLARQLIFPLLWRA